MNGNEFEITFYMSFRKSEYVMHLTYNDEGWIVSHARGEIKSNKKGDPGIGHTFKTEDVWTINENYLGEILEKLLSNYQNGEEKESIQEKMNRLGQWISISERNAPEF